MRRFGTFALLAGLLAGCAGALPEKPLAAFTEAGARLMQAAPDADSKLAVARMLCAKRGLSEGARDFAGCVMALHGRDRALSRARAAAARAAREEPRPRLCTTPGEFMLTRCVDI